MMSIGPALGIDSTSFCSAANCSTDLANIVSVQKYYPVTEKTTEEKKPPF